MSRSTYGSFIVNLHETTYSYVPTVTEHHPDRGIPNRRHMDSSRVVLCIGIRTCANARLDTLIGVPNSRPPVQIA